MNIGRESAHRARLLRFRKALRLALAVWPAFALVDVAVWMVHGGRLGVYLGTRAVGFVAIVVATLMLRTRRQPSAQTVFFFDAFVTPLLCVLVSAQAFELDGIASPLVMGVMLILLGHAAVLGDRWRRAMLPIGLGALAYPLTTLLLAGASGTLAAQAADSHALSGFVLNSLFVIGAGALTLIGGQTVWALRRQVFQTRALGRYRLVEKIGEGGMGEVWRAHHHALDREVAIKILCREKGVDPDAVARFEREANTMSQLRHENTVQVYDYGVTEDGLFYYAMELLEGEDLADLLMREGAIEPETAVAWIRQAADAVAEAHRAGIIHRDLKPENLFVTERDGGTEIKVLDFGLARLTAKGSPNLTRDGFAVGTPSTLAPEIVLGEMADARSDVYSLGSVLYYALTGARPFEGDAAEIMRAKIKHDAPSMAERTQRWIPPHLESVVMRCLARDPIERYADADELAQALTRCPMRGVSVEQELGDWDDVTLVEGRANIFIPPTLATFAD